MASKSKSRSGKVSTEQLFEQAQRQLSKHDAKQALKNAKVCFRQDPCDKHRRLLESAYIARGEELLRSGFEPQAQEALKELLRLGVTEPLLQQRLVELSAALGMLSQTLKSGMAPGSKAAGALDESDGKAPSREAAADSDALRALAADHAVVRGGANADQEIRQGAQLIRTALEALERGEDATALDGLNGVARRSLFADWKLFVRGMAAYYAGDSSRMQANFDRLDPNRKAHRIAQQILVLAAPEGDEPDPVQQRLADYLCQDGLSTRINRLKQHLNGRRWSKAVAELRGAINALSEFDPTISDRLVVLVCELLRVAEQESALNTLWRSIQPLPSDPHWNRSKALFYDTDSELSDAETYWLAFLNDVREMENLSSEERRIIEGHILHRVGTMRLTLGKWAWEEIEEIQEENEDYEYDDLPDVVKQLKALQEESRKHWRHCLDFMERATQVAPELEMPWQAAEAVCRLLNDPERAAQIRRRRLEHFPAEGAALSQVTNELFDQDMPMKARDLLLRAHKAKPGDELIRRQLREAHAQCARHAASQKEFDAARVELDAAEQLATSAADSLWDGCRRAALEFKARRDEQADALLRRVQATLEEPGPMWLAMAVEARRFKLPEKVVQHYNQQWEKSLRRKASAATAMMLGELLASIQQIRNPNKEHDRHVEQLVAYLKKAMRCKFSHDGLYRLCEVALDLDLHPLLEKIANKGIRNFKDSGIFQEAKMQVFLRQSSSNQGSWNAWESMSLVRKARNHANKAMALYARSSDKRDRERLEDLRVIASKLTQMTSAINFLF